ncbi:MAG: 23S rRNA (pseudouridine(1915)-N(3))-methyltransferase RlmH [Alphaproteobacteria bacterium]|nr:23S rRNA (pseudouridine(1915)-N(3))-methyltransferase RlmH [Alphaproteobacteria bacterium]
MIAVGRLRDGPERALFEAYAGRLQWPVRVEEITLKPNLSPAAQKAQATQKLFDLVPEGAVRLALDGGGKTVSSADFAARIGQWRDEGRAGLCFLIGGAEGLDRVALERADLVLSLGAMTWPHLLVRGLLAEQLYRAQQILTGHPYHRA